MIDEKIIKALKSRLKRVEGQVRGIEKMIENKEYCIDVLQQIAAVRGAIKGIAMVVLENHINTCVKDAVKSRKEGAAEEKTKELMEVYEKFSM